MCAVFARSVETDARGVALGGDIVDAAVLVSMVYATDRRMKNQGRPLSAPDVCQCSAVRHPTYGDVAALHNKGSGHKAHKPTPQVGSSGGEALPAKDAIAVPKT